MNFIIRDPLLGVQSPSAPGYPAVHPSAYIFDAYDPILGGAELIYAYASTSMAPGQIVQYSIGQDSNGNMLFQATPWTGTAYSGQELGVCLASVGQGQYGWFQITGNAIVNYGPTSAGQTISSIVLTSSVQNLNGVSTTIYSPIVTMTTAAAHGRSVGDQITISGATPAQYNGTFVVLSVPTSTTLTFSLSPQYMPTTNYVSGGSYTYLAGPVTGQTVTGISLSGTAATVTTSSNHNLQVGDTVVIANATGVTGVNGTWVVTVGGTTTFQFATTLTGSVTGSPTYTVTSPGVNNLAYYSSKGTASSVLVAGKHLLGGQWGTGTGATLSSGKSAVVLPAWQAVLYIGRASGQGSIT